MIEVPLQVVDDFLRSLNAGLIVLALFVLSVLATLPLKSTKALALTIVGFGAILAITPVSLAGDSILFRLIGVGLLAVGPMLYVAGRR